VRSCLSKEVCPVGAFSFFDGLEVSQSGLLGSGVEVAGLELFCPVCVFGELVA